MSIFWFSVCSTLIFASTSEVARALFMSAIFTAEKHRCAVGWHKIYCQVPRLDVGCLSRIMNKCEGNAWKCLRGVHGQCNYKQTVPNLSENLFFWTNRGSERRMFKLKLLRNEKMLLSAFHVLAMGVKRCFDGGVAVHRNLIAVLTRFRARRTSCSECNGLYEKKHGRMQVN